MMRRAGLGSEEPSAAQLAAIAAGHGLRLGEATLDRRKLGALARATPAIVRLANGNAMLLLEVTGAADAAMATLYDPAVGEATPLVIELARLAAAADGGVLLIQRDGVADESRSRPFDMSWLLHEVMRERRQFRDIAIAALSLSLLALAPAIFWQLLVDRVLVHRSLSTLNVLVGGMAFIIVFDTLFGYARRSLILFATARIDVRLSTFVFDRLLDLRIDYFERTPTGVVTRDVNEIWRIRNFLTGQLFEIGRAHV